MSPGVARQKDDFAAGEFARKQLIRWRAEWSFNRDPFLVCEPFDVIKPAAADYANPMLRLHAGGL